MNSSNNQPSPAISDDFLQQHFVPPEFLSNLDVHLNNDHDNGNYKGIDNDNTKNSLIADDQHSHSYSHTQNFSSNQTCDHNSNYNHNHNYNYSHKHNHNQSHKHNNNSNHSHEEILLPFYETPNSIISFSPQQSQLIDLSTAPQESFNYFNYPSYNRSCKQYLLDKSNTNESFHKHLKHRKTNNNTKEKELNKNSKNLEKNILNSFLSLVKPVDQNKQSIPSSASNFQKNIKNLTKEFKCDQCSNSFTRKTRLKEHKNRIHLGKVLRFECKFCGTVLSSRENLTRHQIVHTDKFKCNHCDKRFDRSYRFQRHVIKCNNNILIG